MNLDIVTAHTGASCWLSRSAPYLPLAALAVESYPAPGGSLAVRIPLQAALECGEGECVRVAVELAACVHRAQARADGALPA